MSGNQVSYSSKQYYGWVSVIVPHDNNMNVQEVKASQQEIHHLVKAVLDDDMSSLESHLNASGEKNISDQMINVPLPKQWHHVAKTAMSTPLRTALTWRNAKALSMILDSKCIVSPDDISLGFQKILRHMDGDTEVDLIRHLVRRGATIEGPVHLTFAFEKLLMAGNIKLCNEVVTEISQSSTSTAMLGQLFLAVAKRSVKNYEAYESSKLTEFWTRFSIQSSRQIFETNFSPTKFVSDTKVWLSFGSVPFQHLVHALPLLIQLMTQCPEEALGWVLRHIGRYYPHTCAAGKDKVRQLPRLMWEAGMNVPKIMSVACLSPRFMADTGFSYWTTQHKTKLKTLQHQCRSVIRSHVSCGNIYRAVQETSCIPTPIKDCLLLKEVQKLPWNDNSV